MIILKYGKEFTIKTFKEEILKHKTINKLKN